MHQVLLNGKWQDSKSTGSFSAFNPKTTQPLEDVFPVSHWDDIDLALESAAKAAAILGQTDGGKIAAFLDAYAAGLEADSEAIRTMAHLETALPFDTRLVGELGRTIGQLRQAAEAARSMSWTRATIDTEQGVRSCLGSLGPVAVFGPNNFPLAYGGISGGDFASAIAAGNPVIAKANPMHPMTTKLMAEIAQKAAEATGMPDGTVQLIYHMDYADGEKMIRDPRLASVGFTGSRKGGLALKKVADEVGKPIYLELSSVNPVVILPGAIAEDNEKVASELAASCTMAAGQFCTNPGFVIVRAGEATEQFIATTASQMQQCAVGTLFSQSGQDHLNASIETLKKAGASLVVGGEPGGGEGFSHGNTVLRVDAAKFLQDPSTLQSEAFGPSTLFVVTDSVEQMVEVINLMEGNLTGCFYSATDGSDDQEYDVLEPHLRRRVGRLINDKMPTGVAVSSAMNHGGPYPATGHPGFTAVGMPASVTRFAMLNCYDNVRAHRLPKVLQDKNPGNVWRMINGNWSTDDVS